MRELAATELSEVNGALSAEKGFMLESLIATGAFAFGLSGIGTVALLAAGICVYMME